MALELTRFDGSGLELSSAPGAAAAAAALRFSRSVAGARGWIAAAAGAPLLDGELRGADFAAAALDAFLAEGDAALARLGGAFAVAFLREDGAEAVLATDRCGIVPVFWSYRDGCLVFGSSGRCLQVHPRARADVDPQGLFHLVWFHIVPAPGTARRGHERLLPGTFVRVRGGRAAASAYWTMDYHASDRRPLRLLEREFRDLVEASVAAAAHGAALGCFLSGGTDSSTVSGMLGRVLGRPARTFSIGFAAAGYDEMEYARAAAEHFRTEHVEYYVTPDDVVAAIPRIAEVHSDPFANESAVPTYWCARKAREAGVERMLAGDGGDELFGGNARYATHKLLGLYDGVPSVLKRWLLEPVVFGFPFGDRLWPVRKARGYIRQARLPMPDRMLAYNHVERLGRETIFEPDFLRHVDPDAPRELFRRVFREARAASPLNRELALDLRFTLADNDLPKVNRSCELAGVEVAYPMLSDRLIAFSAGLPERWKLRGFRLRWFFKHALRDFLPRKILRKKKHGFGLPFGVWLREHAGLQGVADDALRSLARRGIVRPAFLHDVVRLHRTEHAGYYGVAIWFLMMLEHWFRAHVDAPASRPSPARPIHP
jgi:asparagine synthase (glutamine-hydrolysing)